MKKTFLVTGGAGYIGTNLIYYLLKNDYEVVVADNLSNSTTDALQRLEKHFNKKIKFYKGDLCDEKFTDMIFSENNITDVVHLAAKKYIGESFKQKDEYIANNNGSTAVLLDCMSKRNVKNICFASSISVFGNPVYLPIDNNHPLSPLSPYAQTKVDGEKLITLWQSQDASRSAVLFRFTNPVGARTDVMLGDSPTGDNSTLFPYLIRRLEDGLEIGINGNTHPTKDGTTVRDYIHITDLTDVVYKVCTSNNVGLKHVIVGNGKITYSVLDVVKTLEQLYNKQLNYKINPKRENDVPLIEIDNSDIVNLFDYRPKCLLFDMLKSHLDFEHTSKQFSVSHSDITK